MPWIKTLHIVLVASWFAGLFYLPRIFVNLAMVEPGSLAERQRLLLMARKLLRFMNILVGPALLLGLVLWLYYGIGKGPGNPWMHAKLLFVLLALGYHHVCGRILRQIETDAPKRSHLWYRGFNEWPVLIMLITVALVVIKPADLGEFFLHLTLPVMALIVLAWVMVRAQRG
jgi:putative membrane protein